MPRVSGDSFQAGSAWLAAAPPTWLVPIQKVRSDFVQDEFDAIEAIASEEAHLRLLRATVAKSSAALRRKARRDAA